MSRQLLFEGKAHRLEAPRPLGKSKDGFALGMTWRLTGTALLGLVAAGIVAVVVHGRDPATKQAAVATPAAKPASTPAASKPRPQPEVATVERTAVGRPADPAPAAAPPPAQAPRLAPSPVPPLPPALQATASPPQSTGLVAESTAPATASAMAPVIPAPPVSLPGPGGAPTRSGPGASAALQVEASRSPEEVKADRVSAGADTPVDCLPPGLRRVLADVGSRFGPVTLVSTTHLHTDNHTRGSARHKLHAACKAVDFKVQGANIKAVIAFLRSRTEVNGINDYHGSLIHIDASASAGTRRAENSSSAAAAVQKPIRKIRRARGGSRRAGPGEPAETTTAPEVSTGSAQ